MVTHFDSAKFSLKLAINAIDAIEETNTPEQLAIRDQYLADFYYELELAMRHIQVALNGKNE